MLFTEKLAEKNRNLTAPPVTAAFLGDSVTHGSFELYDMPGGFGGVYDCKSVYHNRLKESLAVVFPQAQLNVINAGVGGDSAAAGLARLNRDVLRFHPDLVVVAFGLNDAPAGLDAIGTYKSTLDKIFKETKQTGADVVFMTENMMCTYVDPSMESSQLIDVVKRIVEIQNEGVHDRYVAAAAEVCADNSVMLCDCYQVWKKLFARGADVTQLLSNKINHPTREMHSVFSNALFDLIIE